MLRCCLYGILPVGTLDKTTIGIYLFHQLEERGFITPRNVKLLSEIADITCSTPAIQLINDYKTEHNIKDSNVEFLKPYRRRLVETLISADKTDFANVVATYKLNKFNYEDIWDAVHALEKNLILEDEPRKIEKFANVLQKHVKAIFLGQARAPGIAQGNESVAGVDNPDNTEGYTAESMDLPGPSRKKAADVGPTQGSYKQSSADKKELYEEDPYKPIYERKMDPEKPLTCRAYGCGKEQVTKCSPCGALLCSTHKYTGCSKHKGTEEILED